MIDFFENIVGNKNFVTVDIRDEENIKILGALLVLKPNKKSKEYSIYLTEIRFPIRNYFVLSCKALLTR